MTQRLVPVVNPNGHIGWVSPTSAAASAYKRPRKAEDRRVTTGGGLTTDPQQDQGIASAQVAPEPVAPDTDQAPVADTTKS